MLKGLKTILITVVRRRFFRQVIQRNPFTFRVLNNHAHSFHYFSLFNAFWQRKRASIRKSSDCPLRIHLIQHNKLSITIKKLCTLIFRHIWIREWILELHNVTYRAFFLINIWMLFAVERVYSEPSRAQKFGSL